MSKSVLVYLKEQLGRNGDFLPEWQRLSDEGKKDLREAAAVEMK